MSNFPHNLLGEWTAQLSNHAGKTKQSHPSYWADDPSVLHTSCTINNALLGTGEALISSILPSILSAQHEILIVTCFWARSPSQAAIGDALKQLSAQAISRGAHKIRVRICFSSLSFTQKLFHTFSRHGQTYPSSTWVKKFGLPHPDELSGLDLEIKSLFFLPFSVIHPKYIIIDRNQAWLPSCNVSWESWFEDCVAFQGNAVRKMLVFHHHVWGHDVHDVLDNYSSPTFSENSTSPSIDLNTSSALNQVIKALPDTPYPDIPTLILPSPHHINPRFRFLLPFLRAPSPPPTPLNIFTLTLLAHAHTEIYMQTPNLTSPPVVDAVIDALSRGVAVTIVTNRTMMFLEQLVTAGTLTEICIWRLVRRYKALLRSAGVGSSVRSGVRARLGSKRKSSVQPSPASPGPIHPENLSSSPDVDVESGLRAPTSPTHPDSSPQQRIGRLRIYYYKPRLDSDRTSVFDSNSSQVDLQPGLGPGRASSSSPSHPDQETLPSPPPHPEPVKSHLKLLIVDSSTVLLGSGNMDRASWYTSQELGVAFSSESFAGTMLQSISDQIISAKRGEVYFAS
ncbi:hypothetical protein L228DRAFT_286228 [Xylona heveae TC161]|uniref:PLD phosphodiesterase domain-containing protein n=1 Tax=Xylona heveae (strain CBS 132557 / TC161) TaxID=1328760 RepID=A0A164ZEG8_XYLHT|nr:hypothetical protein L228DRAFT_286228 [Xylona heveae TC161]KZF18998.1 hypothetical protein L228DRAFT_286228 [Xylona heveae TC161]